MNGFIIFICVTVLILIAILVLVLVIRRKLRDLSQDIFGTASFSKGLKSQKEKIAETPRSVSSMTRIYLPQIQKDFPEFNLQEFTPKAENLLENYLTSISDKKPLKDDICSQDLKNQVQNIIDDLNNQQATQHFSGIVIHDTQISMYKDTEATKEITFQSSVGYTGYLVDKNGILLSGQKDIKTQTVYEICLVYVQDADKLKEHNIGQGTLGLNCPNCGAAIKNIGTKFCEYCGTGIKEINIYSWKFNRINEKTTAKRHY